jgi:hypothetical protein
MPERTPLDWEDLERELHAAGVSPEEIEAGARRLLAQARGHQLAETRKVASPGVHPVLAVTGLVPRQYRPRPAGRPVPHAGH